MAAPSFAVFKGWVSCGLRQNRFSSFSLKLHAKINQKLKILRVVSPTLSKTRKEWGSRCGFEVGKNNGGPTPKESPSNDQQDSRERF
jgi:hypothetical protein